MDWFIPLAAGAIFAVWHSFSDALAWRIFTAWYSPRRRQIHDKASFVLRGQSRCEFCEARIPWYGLIPVFGYFLVKGHCGNCTRAISYRFPVFESLAFIYGAFAGYRNTSPATFAILIVAYALIWIVITIDYRMLLIPTETIFGLMALGIFDMLVFRHPQWYEFQNIDLALDLSVAFIWYAFFHLLRILSRYKMGLADVRLVLALGFLLGHPYALYLPGLAAGLAIIFYLLRRRSLLIYAPSETQIPFGVFLGTGFLLLSLIRVG